MSKVIKYSLIGLLVFYIATQPANAAQIARDIGGGLMAAATGLGSFISQLA